jgi:hypothetical protein
MKEDEVGKASLGEIRNAYEILIGKAEDKEFPGRAKVYGKMILKWILKK